MDHGERDPGKPSEAGSVRELSAPGATRPPSGAGHTSISAVGGIAAYELHLHRGLRPPARWPHQVGVIPPRAQSFQHRAEADRLHAAIRGGGTAVLSQVLTGTGGVGKTQLAADYAHTAWDDGSVDVLVWVNVSTRSAAVTGYATAGAELCLADPDDPERAAAAFLAWLEPKSGAVPCRWLVVLDDLADPADLRGLWPPESPTGQTLVTTRRRDAALTGARRHLLDVGVYTPDEAAAYLTSALAAHGLGEPADQITGLAADLGHLPLALAQAAAYIADAGLTCAAYRQRLADQRRKLADLLPEPGALPDDHEVTVAATWALSVERADGLHPAGLARPMLHLLSILDPNGIPDSVLTSEPARAYLTAHRTPGGGEPAAVTDEEAAGALRVLRRLSLIDHTPDTPHQSVRVHQLIQRTTRDTLSTEQRVDLARAAADALTAAWPTTEPDRALAQALRANVTALADQAQGSLWEFGCPTVLIRGGDSLHNAGLVADALDYWLKRHAEARRYLPAGHSDILTVRSHLADARGRAGYPVDAAEAFQELLTDALQVWEPGHPDMLAMRHNLAHWRGEAGSPRRAAADLEALLGDYTASAEPVSADALVIRNSLALWRGQAGDAAGAAADFEALLKDSTQILGPDHSDVLKVRGNLARFLGDAGHLEEAIAMLEELQATRERKLGRDHRDVLTTRHNLATMRGRAGDPGRAAADFAALLEDRLRMLGPEHPDISATRTTLAHWRALAGTASPDRP